jgi:Zn-dependent protease with chaperone function
VKPAALVFVYAVVVAWGAPVLLAPLTARGLSAKLGIAAWMAAMMSAVAAATAAVCLLVSGAIAGWGGLAEVICRSVAGHACAATVYTSAAFESGLAAVAVVATLAALALGWRYGRSVQRSRQQSAAHAQAARIVGNRLPGHSPAVVLDSEQPAAYCVAGRPSAIVLTTGALELLDPAQLGAVLAHERAHLSGRHHLLIALGKGLAVVFPGVPIFARGTDHVARLAEMSADDEAARQAGARTLLGALLALGTGAAVPATALGAMAGAASARVQRLLDGPHRGERTGYAVVLAVLILMLTAAPVLLALIACHGPSWIA